MAPRREIGEAAPQDGPAAPAGYTIDLAYPAWHTEQDDLDHVSARSLQVVGDVVLAAWPDIEKRLASTR